MKGAIGLTVVARTPAVGDTAAKLLNEPHPEFRLLLSGGLVVLPTEQRLYLFDGELGVYVVRRLPQIGFGSQIAEPCFDGGILGIVR